MRPTSRSLAADALEAAEAQRHPREDRGGGLMQFGPTQPTMGLDGPSTRRSCAAQLGELVTQLVDSCQQVMHRMRSRTLQCDDSRRRAQFSGRQAENHHGGRRQLAVASVDRQLVEPLPALPSSS